MNTTDTPHTSSARRDTIKRLAGLIAIPASLSLSACASPAIESYASTKPALDLRQYFNGHISAHGMLTDRSGKILRRFTVSMHCTWQGDQGVLDEDFVFDDGEKQKRIWRLTYLGDGRYVGRADDVVGEAMGRSVGAAFQWMYTLRIPYKGKTIDVNLDDWMILVDDKVMLNRAVMSKFGFKVAEIQLAFSRQDK